MPTSNIQRNGKNFKLQHPTFHAQLTTAAISLSPSEGERGPFLFMVAVSSCAPQERLKHHASYRAGLGIEIGCLEFEVWSFSECWMLDVGALNARRLTNEPQKTNRPSFTFHFRRHRRRRFPRVAPY